MNLFLLIMLVMTQAMEKKAWSTIKSRSVIEYYKWDFAKNHKKFLWYVLQNVTRKKTTTIQLFNKFYHKELCYVESSRHCLCTVTIAILKVDIL